MSEGAQRNKIKNNDPLYNEWIEMYSNPEFVDFLHAVDYGILALNGNGNQMVGRIVNHFMWHINLSII